MWRTTTVSAIKNDRIMRVLAKKTVDKTPVWVMRQAGRYLPEYRKIRAQAGSFLALCENPELACEVTMQPIKRFELDAAIIFSDILTIPDAMGLGLEMIEKVGPTFRHPITSTKEIESLTMPDPQERLGYVMQAIKLVKHELAGKLPLIGFAGSPWTVATYMIENGSSKTFSKIKKLLYCEPNALITLLEKLTSATIAYLKAQIQAGADLVMIFDTWGAVLSTPHYQAFSLKFMQEIITAIKKEYPHLPTILFTKNGGLWLEAIANTGTDAVGLDWTIEMAVARARIGDQVVLQGNLDPAILYADFATIREQVKHILQQMPKGHGHIFNLGHGIYPDVPVENMAYLIECVNELARA